MDVSKLHISTDANNKRIINGQYRIVRKIGQGQLGKVLLSECLKCGLKDQYVAIKTINRIDKTQLITKTYLNHMTKIKREIQIMKECNHPNVVKLYQVIDDLKYDKILLVLEYCDQGEIDWKKYNHYTEKLKNGLTINKILRDVINGLEYLHEYKGIIHRDLKPSNLLIKDNSIKISDFGVSLILENNANDARELGKTMGTPAFFAPELCQFVNNRLSMINDIKHKKIDKRIDIWSLGVILYCLIFNELPFNGKNEFSLFKNIVNKDLKFPKTRFSPRFTEMDRREYDLLIDLISKILVKDPNKRYSVRDIKNHEFTTFDMSLSESTQFRRFNDDIINTQMGLTNKIKKFFGGRPMEGVSPIKVEKELDNYENLEPVDDLLDSYFDSSSLGSIESDEENDDTSIYPHTPELQLSESHKAQSEKPLTEKAFNRERATEIGSFSDKGLPYDRNTRAAKANSFSERTNPVAEKSPVFDKSRSEKANSFSDKTPFSIEKASKTKSRLSDRVTAPPALSILKIPPMKIPASTPLAPVATPLSASSSISSSSSLMSPHIVTIGPNSPSSAFYSPTRTFFDKINSMNHTISSLSSPTEGKHKEINDKLDLEPPSIFKAKQAGRKNSFGSPLMRITSSSSSLNLNAYLTDDNASINLRIPDSETEVSELSEAEISDSSDNEGDSTFVLPDETRAKYRDMSDYLDNLD